MKSCKLVMAGVMFGMGIGHFNNGMMSDLWITLAVGLVLLIPGRD